MDQKSEESRLFQTKRISSQRSFEAWLLKNAGNEQADGLLHDVLEDCRNGAGTGEWIQAFEQFKINIGSQQLKPQHTGVHSILFWAQRIAAILFIPLMLLGGYLLFSRNQPVIWEELFVPLGETRQLVLSDGTTVWLNGGSKLIYPDRFTGSSRQVFMTGEIFADVAKNPNLPFEMSLGFGHIKVLGTRFNVKSYGEDDDVEVTLFEGSVSFNTGHDSFSQETVILKPGEMMRYNKQNQKQEVIGHHQDESSTWFAGNNFYFMDKSLESICRDLTRRFRYAFVFEDDIVAALRYYAVFQNNESLTEILEVLNIRNDLDIKLKGSTYFISGRGGPKKNHY